jgi:hypothetical protein
MTPFDADIKHWPSVGAFAEYLRTVSRPSWCKGITNHNTYIPNETQWRGLASMESMQTTYVGKGWSAGPHLYLAAEAPKAADRGIWQMTPLQHVGVHAGPCNSSRLGIENVGDFDARPPTPAQYQLLLDVNRAILHAWLLTPDRVNVHKECMPDRTCPGRYLDPAKLRADLETGAPCVPFVGRFRFRVPQAVFTARDVTARLAVGEMDDDQNPATPGVLVFDAGEVVEVGDITAGWPWIRTGVGFVPMGVLERF